MGKGHPYLDPLGGGGKNKHVFCKIVRSTRTARECQTMKTKQPFIWSRGPTHCHACKCLVNNGDSACTELNDIEDNAGDVIGRVLVVYHAACYKGVRK